MKQNVNLFAPCPAVLEAEERFYTLLLELSISAVLAVGTMLIVSEVVNLRSEIIAALVGTVGGLSALAAIRYRTKDTVAAVNAVVQAIGRFAFPFSLVLLVLTATVAGAAEVGLSGIVAMMFAVAAACAMALPVALSRMNAARRDVIRRLESISASEYVS
jgi:peptidoglycan/LPS O-acetylase OafA/YrhL